MLFEAQMLIASDGCGRGSFYDREGHILGCVHGSWKSEMLDST